MALAPEAAWEWDLEREPESANNEKLVKLKSINGNLIKCICISLCGNF
jgi:hypothetical protein